MGLLAVASVLFVASCGEGSEASESEVAAANGTTPSTDPTSSAVLYLDGQGFEDALITHGELLVAFYAPWCGHSKALTTDWHKAAAALKGRMQFAWVDATIERSLVEKYDVGAYPTIKFVRSKGNSELYTGGRKADELIKWAEEHAKPLVIRVAETSYSMYPRGVAGCAAGTEIRTKAECQEAIEALGFSPNPMWASSYEGLPRFCSFRETGDEHMHWNSAPKGSGRGDLAPVCRAESEDAAGIKDLIQKRGASKTLFLALGDSDFFERFSAVTARVRRSGGAWASRIFAFVPVTDPQPGRLDVIRGITERVVFEGDTSDATALEAFVRAEALPLFGEVDDSSAPAYLEAAETGRGQLWLCLDRPAAEDAMDTWRKRFWEVAEGLGAVARNYRGEVPFVWLDASRHPLQAEELGCGPGRPAVVIDISDGPDEASRYHLDLPTDFQPGDVGSFLKSVLAGEVDAVEDTDQADEEPRDMDIGEDLMEEQIDERDDT